jgi:hypothetical protein
MIPGYLVGTCWVSRKKNVTHFGKQLAGLGCFYFWNASWVLRASPLVHWKLACTTLLDEAIHHTGVKVGAAGTPNCFARYGVFRRHGKTTSTAASCMFATYCYWLAGHTDWPACGPYKVPQCLMFNIYSLGVGRENILTENLDVKT